MDPREAKLQQIIELGRKSLHSALISIQDEFDRREDLVVRPTAIRYMINEGRNIVPHIQSKPFNLTDHSESQLLSRAGIPSLYMRKLIELEEDELALKNLHTMTGRMMKDGVLVRRIDELIKGWLSPSFKRMDAAPVFQAFVESSTKKGYVPFKGRNTDYRYQLTFIFPKVFKISANEWIVFGVSLVTGDYGGVAMELNMVILRISCTNLAMGYDLFRKVHLGSRFHMTDGEDVMTFSKKTYELDTRAVSSAVGDVVNHSFDHMKLLETKIKEGEQKEIKDPEPIYEWIKRQGVKKEMFEKIKSTFEMEALPVEVLPKEKSMWRLSNAISLVAQDMKKGDEQIDLEKIAMQVLLEGPKSRKA